MKTLRNFALLTATIALAHSTVAGAALSDDVSSTNFRHTAPVGLQEVHPADADYWSTSPLKTDHGGGVPDKNRVFPEDRGGGVPFPDYEKHALLRLGNL